MRVLLVAVNAKYIHSNLAVYCLKAYAGRYLRAEGAQIEIAEYTINQTTDEILRDLYRRRPGMLCLSCYIWNRVYVEELLREVPKVLPDCALWLGGPEVSYDAREVLRRLPEVDGVMRGEGEQTFCELVRCYLEEDGPSASALGQIEGLTFRVQEEGAAGDGEIRETPWRPPMDLDQLPFVYEDMAPFDHKIVYYESSRGCPFSCSYCLSSIDKCLRFRSLELVKRELQFFLDHRVPQVKFVDRTFNCRHEHACAIWRYLLEHDNGVTNFHFEIAADLLNDEELELLSRLRPGQVQLEIGVQSTNPQTIREIRRTMRFGEVARVVERIRAGGNIHQHLDLIAGLPYEDYDSFGRSFDEVFALRPQQLQLGFLKVLKGSFMEEKQAEYGLVCKSAPPYEVLCTRWLSYGDVLRLKGIEEMVELYYNSGQFACSLPWLIGHFPGPFACFQALAAYYEEQGLCLQSQARSSRYEILLRFAGTVVPEQRELFRQLLTLDYYLRENAKSRPDFAGEERISREWLRDFYDREDKERRFLHGYEAYDRRSLRRMTHVEAFSYMVLEDMRPGSCILLFDYQNRTALDRRAAVYQVEPAGPRR